MSHSQQQSLCSLGYKYQPEKQKAKTDVKKLYLLNNLISTELN